MSMSYSLLVHEVRHVGRTSRSGELQVRLAAVASQVIISSLDPIGAQVEASHLLKVWEILLEMDARLV